MVIFFVNKFIADKYLYQFEVSIIGRKTMKKVAKLKQEKKMKLASNEC